MNSVKKVVKSNVVTKKLTAKFINYNSDEFVLPPPNFATTRHQIYLMNCRYCHQPIIAAIS